MSSGTGRPPPVEEWRLNACAFFIFAPIGVQLPFFPLWIAHKGFSPTLIATLVGLSQVVRFLANLAVPPLADRTDTATVLLLSAAVAFLAQSLCALPLGVAWIFALWLLASAGQAPLMPLQDSIILREVRQREIAGAPPLHYGRVRSYGSASVLILMLAGGALAAVTPPDALIAIIAGSSAAAVGAIAFFMPRERGSGVADPRPVATAGGTNRGLLALVIAGGAAVQASHAMVYTFGSIGWRQAGYGDAAIGALWAAGVATEVAFFAFANRLARGRDLSFVFLIGGASIALVRWLVMATQPGPLTLLVAQFAHAGSFAATYLGTVTALSRLAGEGRRAKVQGWVSGATSLSLAAATVVCGPLWAAYEWRGYLFVAALAGVGLVCAVAAALASVVPQPQSAGSGGNTTEPS